jgi:uncharacterized phage protein gp47/JayE
MLIRPNYTSIFSSLYTDFSTGLSNVPIARFSILGSLGRALARGLDSVYGYVDGTFLNAVPWTARGTAQDAWAALWGVTRLASASATGSASFTFNAAAIIPAGSPFIGSNTVTYTSSSDTVASSAGTYSVSLVTATTGAITNMPSGSIMTLTTPIANVVPSGTVNSMTGGFDSETDAGLFSRAQEVRSNPPQGGAIGDYVEWALASNLVTRAWVQPFPAQPGNVVVFIMLDGNSNSGFPIGTDGTATQDTRGSAATGDQLETANYIYQPFRRPVTAFVQVVSPIAQPINVTLTNCNPLSTVSQAAVIAALNARLLLIGTPLGQTIQTSDLTSAVSSVLISYDLILPVSTTTITLGNLPTLGTVIFS